MSTIVLTDQGVKLELDGCKMGGLLNTTDCSEQSPPGHRKETSEKVNRRDEAAELATDEQLLANYVAGDDACFASLVDRYSRELYPFLVRYVRDTAMAEDVIQETFLQVHQSAASFDVGRRFRPWLFTIAVNKARDQLRSRVRKREVSLSISSPANGDESVSYLDFLSDAAAVPSQGLETVECRDRVRAIIADMPANLREVLVLGYYHHFPYKEMAEILAIPLGTVKSRLHAAVSCFAAGFKRAEQGEATTQ
ncbi:MAG: sigma-70 family RNA polymerase sigma factor [Planctomycetota bacterium]|nr:sigma-70 family RNA polymerase sigma factor [Planctomycetota bacterium]